VGKSCRLHERLDLIGINVLQPEVARPQVRQLFIERRANRMNTTRPTRDGTDVT
jgi:hypothetical protein